MKTVEQIVKAFDNLQTSIEDEETRFPSMTYEEGVKEALLWVLGEIPKDEFPYNAYKL